MADRITNALLAGLGIASLGRKRFLKVYKDLIKEGESAKRESEFLKSRWHRVDAASAKVENIVAGVMQKANLATKNQIDELNRKIDKLLKEKKSR